MAAKPCVVNVSFIWHKNGSASFILYCNAAVLPMYRPFSTATQGNERSTPLRKLNLTLLQVEVGADRPTDCVETIDVLSINRS